MLAKTVCFLFFVFAFQRGVWDKQRVLAGIFWRFVFGNQSFLPGMKLTIPEAFMLGGKADVILST
jgi:hypothetical protein